MYKYKLVTNQNGEQVVNEMEAELIGIVKSNILSFYKKSKVDNLERKVVTDDERVREAEKIVLSDMEPVTRETFIKEIKEMYSRITETEFTEEDDKIIKENFNDLITESLEEINSEDLPQKIEINNFVFWVCDEFIDYKKDLA